LWNILSCIYSGVLSGILWLGKTWLTSGGAGVGARGRGQDEGGEEGGRKEGWKEEEEDEELR
jgi:hypothetical protein